MQRSTLQDFVLYTFNFSIQTLRLASMVLRFAAEAGSDVEVYMKAGRVGAFINIGALKRRENLFAIPTNHSSKSSFSFVTDVPHASDVLKGKDFT